MEDLAREAPGNLWMQVFPYKDRGLTQSFVNGRMRLNSRASC